MKTWQKAVFILVLIVFVAASVTISLISISRPPYKYRPYENNEGGAALDGWEFASFNGNASTKKLSIDWVRDRNGNDPDQTKPVVSIGAYAVNADEYVEELYIGPTVRVINETAFFNLKALQRVTVDPENVSFRDIDGVLYSKDGTRLVLFPTCYGKTPTDDPEEFMYAEKYEVPDGVVRIGTFAFLKNYHLRDVTLPTTLREIGDMAFFECSRLGAYDYDKEADRLDGTGFALPDDLETIGADAFSKCGNIAPVLYIPSSVREIGHHAFFSCSGMRDVYLGARDASAMTCGESWMPKSIKAGALRKAPEPQYGKTRADADALIETYRADKLDGAREEAKKNG